MSKLYLITPPEFDVVEFSPQFEFALSTNQVSCVQLRLKQHNDIAVEDCHILQASETLLPIAHKYNVPFLINDRPDLALQAGADGVHLGQDDMSYENARSILGSKSIIGISCQNNRHNAMLAADSGADYVAFGAFYNSSTKDNTQISDLDTLEWWQTLMKTPCVAIGGITHDNVLPLLPHADFIAVSHSVWSFQEGSKASINKFAEIFKSHITSNAP